MLARTLRRYGKCLVATPFDNQPMPIPRVRRFKTILNDLVPVKEIQRNDEVQMLLEKLPRVCDEEKSNLLQAQRASRYYRTRYGRGCEVQTKQASAMKNMTDVEITAWAKARMKLIQNPLDA